jgi:hypothetical protein
MLSATVLAALMAFTANTHAGTMYEGAGSTVQEAMEAAMDTAEKRSRGKCLCKDEGPGSLEDACRKSEKLGGFICKACGSNHKGSCTNKTDLMKKLGL